MAEPQGARTGRHYRRAGCRSGRREGHHPRRQRPSQRRAARSRHVGDGAGAAEILHAGREADFPARRFAAPKQLRRYQRGQRDGKSGGDSALRNPARPRRTHRAHEDFVRRGSRESSSDAGISGRPGKGPHGVSRRLGVGESGEILCRRRHRADPAAHLSSRRSTRSWCWNSTSAASRS